MASYQDIDSRLGVIERKVAFLMQIGTVTKRTPSLLSPSGFTEQNLSLTDLYNELNAQNITISRPSAADFTEEIENGLPNL